MILAIAAPLEEDARDSIRELIGMLSSTYTNCSFIEESDIYKYSAVEDIIIILVKAGEGNTFIINTKLMGDRVVPDYSGVEHSLKAIIANIAGYSECILSNVTVRDSSGKKIKPELRIYLDKPVLFQGLGRLVFDKQKTFLQESPASLPTKQCSFITQSEILSSLLKSSSLWFSFDAMSYALRDEDGSYSITSYQPVDPLIDYLTDCTASNYLAEIIRNKQTEQTKRLEFLITNKRTAREYKEFLSKIPLKYLQKEYDHLSQIIESSPRFDDIRRVFLKKFTYLLYENAIPEEKETGRYLTVYRLPEIPRIKRFTLRRYLQG